MSGNGAEWQHDICGCFDDCNVCVLAWLCPCVSFGKTAEMLGEDCCLCCCAWICLPFNCYARLHIREKIRQLKGIKGTIGKDACLLQYCCWCVLCQEAQEVKDVQPAVMARE